MKPIKEWYITANIEIHGAGVIIEARTSEEAREAFNAMKWKGPADLLSGEIINWEATKIEPKE